MEHEMSLLHLLASCLSLLVDSSTEATRNAPAAHVNSAPPLAGNFFAPAGPRAAASGAHLIKALCADRLAAEAYEKSSLCLFDCPPVRPSVRLSARRSRARPTESSVITWAVNEIAQVIMAELGFFFSDNKRTDGRAESLWQRGRQTSVPGIISVRCQPTACSLQPAVGWDKSSRRAATPSGRRIIIVIIKCNNRHRFSFRSFVRFYSTLLYSFENC